MTILISGATGFLGQTVLASLAEMDEVVALHRPGSKPPPVTRVRWLAQDLAGDLSDSLPIRVDAVVHLAQSRGHRRFPDAAVDVFEVNAAATVRLLDYCLRAGGRTFTYASSGAVYARSSQPVSESDPPRPEGFYAVSKLVGELALEQFRGLLAAHALRFFFIYGPGQRDMLIPGLLDRIRDGRAVSLPAGKGFRVNPVFVEDAADAVIATLALKQGHTVNVAGPDVVSVREIAEQGARMLARSCRFEIGDPAEDLVANISAQCAVLQPPKVGFAEGLRRTVQCSGPP